MEFYSIFCVSIFAVCFNTAIECANHTVSLTITIDHKPDKTTLQSLNASSFFVPAGAQVESFEIETNIIPAQVKLEAIYPKGLRVSVPDDGYNLFGFRGNLNQKLDDRGAQTWVEDVLNKTNDKWVFTDTNIELQLGDAIYYWVFVTMDDKTYIRAADEWTVTEFMNEDGTPAIIPSAQMIDERKRSHDVPLSKPPIENLTPPSRYTPSCTDSRTEVMSYTKIICQGTLIFSEEFDKSNIEELAFWDPEIKFPLEPDYPFNVYMKEDTLRLQNGRLIISPQLLESRYYNGFVHDTLDLTKSCTGLSETLECVQTASGAQILPPVVTGKITTRRKFNFKYGRVEVRAKLPHGNWLLPEINLEPLDKAYGKLRYESGLMRIAFAKGNDNFANILYGGPILYDKEPFRSQFIKEIVGSDNWNKDFHNYTMIWKPDSIEWFVDGEMYGAVNPGIGFYYQLKENGAKDAKQWIGKTRMAPLDEMFYVSLGLQVGGINDFDDSPDKPWGNKSNKAKIKFWNAKNSWLRTWTDADMKVDYVRIYAL